MLTLVVAPNKEEVLTADGRTMKVYALLAEGNGGYHCFQEQLTYGQVDDVEIFVVKRLLPFWAIPLNLTPGIKRGIVEFLAHYHGKQNLSFDCYAFAGMTLGLQQHDKKHLWSLWDFCPLRLLPKVGDVLFFFLAEDRQLFRHAAVYIGRGMYLSVYGAGGDLEISSLADMRRDYGAWDVVRAIPRTLELNET